MQAVEPQEAPPTAGLEAAHEGDGITFVEVLNILIRHRWWIVVPALALSLLFAVRVAVSEEDAEYQASTTFAATARSQPQEGNALARQLGIGGSNASTPGSPNYYAALLTSRPLLRNVVEDEYRVVMDGDTVEDSLIEIWGMERATEEAAVRAAASRLSGRVETRTDRATGFVTVTVSAEAPELAEQLATRLLDALQEYNREEHRVRAVDESRFLSEQLATAQQDLSAAQDSLAAFLRRNRAIGEGSELMFERERLQRQVDMREDFTMSIFRSLERLRMDQARDMPVIRVVESASGSATRTAGQPILPMAALGFVLGAIFGVLLAFAAEFFQRVRTGSRPDYAELRSLLASMSRVPRRLVAPIRRRSGT